VRKYANDCQGHKHWTVRIAHRIKWYIQCAQWARPNRRGLYTGTQGLHDDLLNSTQDTPSKNLDNHAATLIHWVVLVHLVALVHVPALDNDRHTQITPGFVRLLRCLLRLTFVLGLVAT